MSTTKTRRIRIDGILYPYNDAKENVVIDRSLMDIWSGKKGRARECMNARCIQRQPELFPHPVLAVSVTSSRVFVLDSLDHAVRYLLSTAESERIKQHDTEGSASPGKLTLYAPKGKNKKGAAQPSRTRPNGTGNRNGKYEKALPRGEKARLVVAVGAMDQS